MMDETYKMIRRFGVCKQMAKGKDKGLYQTVCQGCGKVIRSDEDLNEIEMVYTKRGDMYFWHRACTRSVWGSQIKWKEATL